VVNANAGRHVCRFPVGIDCGHIGKGEAMMFVVISKKRECGILVLHKGFEYRLVPRDHFVKPPRHVNHMG